LSWRRMSRLVLVGICGVNVNVGVISEFEVGGVSVKSQSGSTNV
jgi:hypothetical protein